jgi:hypothetical protein
MSLYDQIIAIYPDLKTEDFNPFTGTIFLQDDSNGKGPYIKSWTNEKPQPTAEQLAATGK